MKQKRKKVAKYFDTGGTIGKVLTGLGGGAEVLGSAINAANDPYNQTAEVENDIAAQNNLVSSISGASSFDDLMNLDLNQLSHTRYQDFLPNKLSQAGNIIGASMAGAGTGAGVGGGWGALAGGVIGLGTGLFGNIRAKKNAKKLSRAYNKQIDDINARQEWALGNTISDIKSSNLLNTTYAAYGGPLAMRYKGNMSPFGNRFAEGGGIYIEPSKRGTFTAAAKKHGKSVQAFASQVLANKDNYSPAMVKKANFARNASKWKHADGGPVKKANYDSWYKTIPTDRNDTTLYNLRRAYELAPYSELEAWRTSSPEDLKNGKNHLRTVYRDPKTGIYEFMKSKNHPTLHFETEWYNSDDPEAIEFRKNYRLDTSGDYYRYIPRKKAFGGGLNTQGGDFTNGLTYIDNGGTHEENPMEGIQMGVDPQGIPNLVEEGETIWNDYVFSNRIKVPKAVRNKYKLRGPKNMTFADASKYISKESDERPNDPISQRGLEAGLARLVQEQEAIRQEQQAPQGIQYAKGGPLNDDNTTYIGTKSLVPDYYSTLENPGDQDITDLTDGSSESNNTWLLMPSNTSAYTGNTTSILNPTLPKKSKSTSSDLTWLRYLPAAGGAIGALQGIFSKPRYSRANSVLAAANQSGRYKPVGYTPFGNYLTYNPFDIDYAANKAASVASAGRRAAVENSAGNRAFATASTLASDYNTQLQLGDLYRQAEAYNQNLRKTIADYNRGIDATNAELGLKAAMANQDALAKANQSRLSGITQAMNMMEAIDQARGTSISANLSNLFNSLGDIGKEEFARNMVISSPGLYYSVGRDGTITYKDDFYNLSEAEKDAVRKDAERRSKG